MTKSRQQRRAEQRKATTRVIKNLINTKQITVGGDIVIKDASNPSCIKAYDKRAKCDVLIVT